MRNAVGQPVVLAAVLTIPLLAQEPQLTREGPYWVHTETGSVAVAPHGRLVVTSRGRIIIHGGPGPQITYKFIQKARTKSFDEARQWIASGDITAQPLGQTTRIIVTQNSDRNVGNQLELTVPRNLAVTTVESQFAGGIEAYDLEGQLDARTPAGQIRADRIGGAVTANTAGGDIILGKIGGPVRCFTGAGSITVENAAAGIPDCRTGGGEMVVRNAGAPVMLVNDGGNITVDRALSSVEAHAASGLINVGQAGGSVIADTRGGSIEVGAAQGVRAESAQGAVRVRGASGTMNVSTAIGNILADLMPGARLLDSSLAAGSGDITVSIPSNLPLSVMVTNEGGGYPRLISDFSEIRSKSLGFARSPVLAEGSLNGGGPVLHLNASSGVIYLRRGK